MHLCLFSHQWSHASWWNITHSRSLPRSLQCFHLTSLIPTIRLISVATRKRVPSNSNYECTMHLERKVRNGKSLFLQMWIIFTSPYHISCLPFSSPKIQDKEAAMVLAGPSSLAIWEQARKERWYWSPCDFLRTSSVSEISFFWWGDCSFSLSDWWIVLFSSCVYKKRATLKSSKRWSDCYGRRSDPTHQIGRHVYLQSFQERTIQITEMANEHNIY